MRGVVPHRHAAPALIFAKLYVPPRPPLCIDHLVVPGLFFDISEVLFSIEDGGYRRIAYMSAGDHTEPTIASSVKGL